MSTDVHQQARSFSTQRLVDDRHLIKRRTTDPMREAPQDVRDGRREGPDDPLGERPGLG